jgi:hypothetical protein
MNTELFRKILDLVDTANSKGIQMNDFIDDIENSLKLKIKNKLFNDWKIKNADIIEESFNTPKLFYYNDFRDKEFGCIIPIGYSYFYVLYRGHFMTLWELCNKLGINYNRTYSRLNNGWNFYDAITTNKVVRGNTTKNERVINLLNKY